MKKRIIQHLTEHNSYFKWSAQRIAEKFDCSISVVNRALNELTSEKENYLYSLTKRKA